MTIEPKELEARIKDLLHDKLSMKAFNDAAQADNASEIISAGQYSTNTSDVYLSAIAKLCVENMVLKNKLDSTLQTMEASTRQPTTSMFVEPTMETKSAKPDTFENFHLVFCDRGRSSYYRDVPRMFKGDLISDHLRGQHGLPKDLSNFLQDNPEILFCPTRTYYCACRGGPSYHGTVGYRDGKLIEDSPPAEHKSIRFVLGNRSWDIIKSIIKSHKESFNGYSAANLPQAFSKPYSFFFNHNKTLLDIAASSDLSESDRSCIQMLCNWFENNYREEWDEAREMMSRGEISPKHFAKLFRPDELYVSRAYSDDPDILEVFKSDDYPWTHQSDHYMDMYSWGFNGHFRKNFYQHSMRRFPKRSVSFETEVVITSLRFYPLRFAEPGIKEKLIARGHKFWNCRTRSLVCYRESGEAPMLTQVRDTPRDKCEDEC